MSIFATQFDEIHIMAKTKDQVNRYLTHCKFSDSDWNKILVYCKKNGLGYAHKAAHPKSESTYEDFVEWIRTGYGCGDVVRYGHTIGILSTCTPDYSEFCAYLSHNGDVVVAKLQISTDKIFKACENDRRDIYCKLRLSGLDFNERLGVICERRLPPIHTRISYNYGDVSGYGIIDRLEGGSVHFVFGIEDGEIRTDFCIPLVELGTKDIDKNGLSVMTNTLNRASLKWNHATHQLEKLQPRVRVGETYWYITDKFFVSNATENRSPTCEARYENGNYFVNHFEAVEFLRAIQKLRKELAEK